MMLISWQTLHPESTTCKLVFASTSKAAGITVPVHSIYITALIHTAAVCESVIFGLVCVTPITVKPLSTNGHILIIVCDSLNC